MTRVTSRPAQRSGIGAPVDRVDGTAKTTGAARFSAEYHYADLTHAALVHATISHGTIVVIDTARALAHPGVLAVLTHENVPALAPTPKPGLNLNSLAPGTIVNYLNTDEVFWDGQPVAVVVAETLDAAHHGASLVDVRYRPLPSSVDFASVEGDAVPQKRNALMRTGERKGDAEAALAAAPVTVDERYTTTATRRPPTTTTPSSRTRRPPPGTATGSRSTSRPSRSVSSARTWRTSSACPRRTSG